MLPKKTDIAGAASVPEADAASEWPDDVGTDAREKPREIGGREGPDPTRYGDWEKAGRCIDF